MVATAVVLPVVLTGAALVLSRRRPPRRDEAGASVVVTTLMMVAIGLALVWFARDSLFDAGEKSDRRIQEEVDRNR